MTAGYVTELNLALLLRKRLEIIATTLRARLTIKWPNCLGLGTPEALGSMPSRLTAILALYPSPSPRSNIALKARRAVSFALFSLEAARPR